MANETYFILLREYFHEHMKVLSFFIAFSGSPAKACV